MNANPDEPKKSADFRENPDRCIFLRGEINQEMVDALTPQILKLRAESTKSITVYIDSVGGDTRFAEVILSLLTAPNQDGDVCAIITVVTGQASSAAADFLAAGNYSIAYPHAEVLVHGTRRSVPRLITTEQASFLAAFLKSTNEGFAQRLANRGIHRFLFNFLTIRRDFATFRKDEPNLSDIECLERALSMDVLCEIPKMALKVFKESETLAAAVKVQIDALQASTEDTKLLCEANLLVAILRYEINRDGGDRCKSLSDGGLKRVHDDFALLLDYTSHRHGSMLRSLSRRWGTFFFNDEEDAKWKQLSRNTADEKKAAALWRDEQVIPRIKPVWHYYFAICQLLQSGENSLDAEEAYWLGLVDEVIGTDLPCVRQIIEQAPQKTN